jgi:chromosome segregation ATPase
MIKSTDIPEALQRAIVNFSQEPLSKKSLQEYNQTEIYEDECPVKPHDLVIGLDLYHPGWRNTKRQQEEGNLKSFGRTFNGANEPMVVTKNSVWYNLFQQSKKRKDRGYKEVEEFLGLKKSKRNDNLPSQLESIQQEIHGIEGVLEQLKKRRTSPSQPIQFDVDKLKDDILSHVDKDFSVLAKAMEESVKLQNKEISNYLKTLHPENTPILLKNQHALLEQHTKQLHELSTSSQETVSILKQLKDGLNQIPKNAVIIERINQLEKKLGSHEQFTSLYNNLNKDFVDIKENMEIMQDDNDENQKSIKVALNTYAESVRLQLEQINHLILQNAGSNTTDIQKNYLEKIDALNQKINQLESSLAIIENKNQNQEKVISEQENIIQKFNNEFQDAVQKFGLKEKEIQQLKQSLQEVTAQATQHSYTNFDEQKKLTIQLQNLQQQKEEEINQIKNTCLEDREKLLQENENLKQQLQNITNVAEQLVEIKKQLEEKIQHCLQEKEALNQEIIRLTQENNQLKLQLQNIENQGASSNQKLREEAIHQINILQHQLEVFREQNKYLVKSVQSSKAKLIDREIQKRIKHGVVVLLRDFAPQDQQTTPRVFDEFIEIWDPLTNGGYDEKDKSPFVNWNQGALQVVLYDAVPYLQAIEEYLNLDETKNANINQLTDGQVIFIYKRFWRILEDQIDRNQNVIQCEYLQYNINSFYTGIAWPDSYYKVFFDLQKNYVSNVQQKEVLYRYLLELWGNKIMVDIVIEKFFYAKDIDALKKISPTRSLFFFMRETLYQLFEIWSMMDLSSSHRLNTGQYLKDKDPIYANYDILETNQVFMAF